MTYKLHQFYFSNKSWRKDLAIFLKTHESPTALELNFIYENEINSDIFCNLPSDLKFLKINLSPFVYDDPAIQRKLVESFNNLFQNCQALTELDLSSCRFQDKEKIDIGALLKNAPASLSKLNLSFQRLWEGKELYRILRQLPPSIRELDLSKNLIGVINLRVHKINGIKLLGVHDLLKELMDSLPPTLEFIDLSNNPIENISVEKLAEMLSAENLNPAMLITLLPNTPDLAGKATTIDELRVFTQSLLSRGWGNRSYKEILSSLAQESKLIACLQAAPKTVRFIDLSKITLNNISVARLLEILLYAGGEPTTIVKLLPNKTTTIGALDIFVQSLTPTDKLKPYNELIAGPRAAISWSETGALQIEFDNAASCDAVFNKLGVNEKEYVVPKLDRNSSVYADNLDGLVFRRPEPNILLFTPYKPPSRQAGIDHIGVNFKTSDCLRTFLVQLFHIDEPPDGVSSTYYVDRASHQIKRVVFSEFKTVAGHGREDVLFELAANMPNILFFNSAHQLFQQGSVLELKKSGSFINEFIVEVVDGYIPQFDYQDKLSLLLPTEQIFNERSLLETLAGKCGHSIAAWHYEVEKDQQRGLWLLNNSSVSDEQFIAAHLHPKLSKYMFNKTDLAIKLFSGSAAAKHANWIFVPEFYLQTLKEKDTRFGSKPLFDWLKARFPKTTDKDHKRPDFKQMPLVMTAINEELLVDAYHP